MKNNAAQKLSDATWAERKANQSPISDIGQVRSADKRRAKLSADVDAFLASGRQIQTLESAQKELRVRPVGQRW